MTFRRAARLISLALVCATLSAGCATRSAHNRLLSERRELERSCKEKTQALSRENRVLYEAKLGFEKDISILNNQIEDLRSQLEVEVAKHGSYRESTRQKMKELERLVNSAEENTSKRLQEISARNRSVVDSLLLQIDTLSAQGAALKTRYSQEVQTLKNGSAKMKYDYEKEIYALERMKEELFRKLHDNEVRIQQLLTERFSGTPIPGDSILLLPVAK